MAVTDSHGKESHMQDSITRKMEKLLDPEKTLPAETDSSRRNQRRDQGTSEPPDSDGESLPSLDKIRFDDNIVQIKDPKKERKKRERASAKRTDRKQRREERQQKAVPALSSTSNDSLPFLNKIRFDDHIVAITDPEPMDGSNKKSKKKSKKGSVSPPDVKTADTFTVGDNSGELIVSESAKKNYQAESDFKTKEPAQVDPLSNSQRKSKKPAEDSFKTIKKLEKLNGGSGESKKLKQDKDVLKGSKEDVAPPRREDAPSEANIRIGDRLFSREETEGLLRKLGQLKNDKSGEKVRRYTNFNRIDSCRTSRAASPLSSLRMPPPAAPAPLIPATFPVPPPPVSRSSRSKSNSPAAGSRTNYHRIDSCRTSRASSPQGDQIGMPKQRIRVGDKFMTVSEAEDMLQRMLKANSEKGKQSAARAEAGIEVGEEREPVVLQRLSRERVSRSAEDANMPVSRAKIDKRYSTPTAERANDEADCNFSHLTTVMKRDDEVSAIVIAFVFGIVAFAVLAMLASKVSNYATSMVTE